MGTIILLIGVAAVLVLAFPFARIEISKLAKEGRFFALVKPKRIIFVTKAGGNIDHFVASLNGEGKHINPETGEICDGEVEKGDDEKIWGAHYIGLGEILKYEMELTDDKGNIRKEIASSLHYTDGYYVMIDRAETAGQFPVDILLKVTTETVHAGKTIRYRNWLPQVLDPVKALIRDLAITKDPVDLMKMQNETGDPVLGLVGLVKKLNVSDEGNIGLEERVGQRIVAVNIISIEISDTELKKAMEAKEKAELEGNAAIEAAKKDLEKTDLTVKKSIKEGVGKAKVITTVSIAEANAMKRKRKAVDNDNVALVGLATADAILNTGVTSLAINTGFAVTHPAPPKTGG